jgi:hypothetical protein
VRDNDRVPDVDRSVIYEFAMDTTGRKEADNLEG